MYFSAHKHKTVFWFEKKCSIKTIQLVREIIGILRMKKQSENFWKLKFQLTLS